MPGKGKNGVKNVINKFCLLCEKEFFNESKYFNKQNIVLKSVKIKQAIKEEARSKTELLVEENRFKI